MKKWLIVLICSSLFAILGCSVKMSVRPDLDIMHIRRVAVLPFGLNNTVSDMFTTELIGIGKFDVIERGQLDKVLEEYKLNLSGLLDEKTRKELGRLLGVDAIFLGSAKTYKVAWDGNTRIVTVMNVRLVDIETGTILLSCSATGGQHRNIKKMVRKIRRALK